MSSVSQDEIQRSEKHMEIQEVHLHLDNDGTGRRAAGTIATELRAGTA